MSDRVVIIGIRRGPDLVGKVELAQMAGRAGRSHSRTMAEAFVDVVVPESDHDEATDILSSMDDFHVESVLDTPESIAFQILPDIYNGHVFDHESALAWMGRTFYCYMGGKKEDVDTAIELLVENEAIRWGRDGNLFVTIQGSISASLYFHPEDIMAWRNNFEEIFDRGMEDTDVGVSWALSSVPSQKRYASSADVKFALEEFRDQSSGMGLRSLDGTVASGACWWWLIGGPSVKGMKAEAYSLRKDFGRIRLALEGLNDAHGWNRDDYLKSLDVRITRRVPAEVAPLFSIEGLSKEMAYELYSMGIGSIEELNDKMSMIEASGNERLINAIKKFFGTVS